MLPPGITLRLSAGNKEDHESGGKCLGKSVQTSGWSYVLPSEHKVGDQEGCDTAP